MNRDFKGIWIERAIWLRSDLSCIEKCLLAEIDSLDISDKHCFATNEYFSKFLGVSAPTITRAVKKLEDKKLISVESFRSKNGTIRTITALIKMITPTNQNDETPTNQNDYHNNTIEFNNTINTPKAPRGGESRNVMDKIMQDDFNTFYAAYPKKRGKPQANKAFMKNYKKMPGIQEILIILDLWKKTEDWQKQKGQFIPYPASWLNAEGWNDDIPEAWEDPEIKASNAAAATKDVLWYVCPDCGYQVKSIKVREQCPVCGEYGTSFRQGRGKEYPEGIK